MSGRVLPRAAVTGVGSVPGTDPREAVRRALELPLPHLPELPARGPAADVVGRATALLVDLPVDLQPSGWRLVERPARDGTRARDLLARDLDALEEAVGSSPPEVLKVQVTGPWTLAGSLELQRGERVLRDAGAVRDVQESLAEGVRRHLADLARRLPGTRLVLQVDEPSLPAVLAGRVPTTSGVGTYRAPQAGLALERLALVLSAAQDTGALPVVHCCAPRPPVDLLRRAGAAGVSVDLLQPQDEEALGALVDGGGALLAGVAALPGSDGPPSREQLLAPLRTLWRRLSLPVDLLPDVVLTPSCGLAGATVPAAAALLERLVEAARALEEEPL